MSEGNCYFCKRKHWTERIVICLDCLREMKDYNKAEFIFVVKGHYKATISGSDLESNIKLLENQILPSLHRKLSELKKEKEEE